MKEGLKIKEVYLFQGEETKFNFHFGVLPRYKWMDKIGKSLTSLVPIWKYTKENLTDTKNIKEVEESAQKIKKYLHKQTTYNQGQAKERLK